MFVAGVGDPVTDFAINDPPKAFASRRPTQDESG